MADVRRQIRALMHRVRQSGQLPPSADIVDEAFRELGYVPGAIAPDEVLERFNALLKGVWEHTLHVLERYEQRCYAEGIPRELANEYVDELEDARRVAEARGFRAGVIRLFKLWYPMLRLSFLSVSQSRMQRGGRDFELQIEKLLDLARIPYHAQSAEHRTDFVLPDLETFQRNRNVSAVISVKRTLRERWAEVAEELFNLRSPNVFLFTADERVTNSHVERICERYNIHLVVWDHLKTSKFPTRPLVLGYTEWANDRLRMLQQYWRAGKD